MHPNCGLERYDRRRSTTLRAGLLTGRPPIGAYKYSERPLENGPQILLGADSGARRTCGCSARRRSPLSLGPTFHGDRVQELELRPGLASRRASWLRAEYT